MSTDLKREDVFANGVELASVMGLDREHGKRVLTYPNSKKVKVYTFINPVLMTDTFRVSKLPPTLRDTLFSLFQHHERTVEYDNVRVDWNASHVNVWCPSIDTVLFAKALRKVLKEPFRSGVELGCGSGFLSKYALSKFSSLRSMLVNDLNPYAIKCAMDNIKDKRAVFFAGDGLKKIQGMKFDLMLCNPPYVPRPHSINDNPYEGIGLLNHLVHEGQKYLHPNGKLIVNISSLCWDLVLKEKPLMKMKVLERMNVPLKVNNILNNNAWLEYLQHHGLKKKLHQGYEYWQELFIVSLEF